MRFFVQTTPPSKPKTFKVRIASVALAGIFILLAVAQLYSFEDFPEVIASLWLPGGRPLATLLAALLVTGEVLALLFLLSMRLSPAMRVVSMVAGWLVVATWLKLAIIVTFTANAVTNSGVLGATVPLAPGWWMVVLFVILSGLTAWVSWGMWPSSQGTKKTK